MNANSTSGPVAPARLFANLRWWLLRNTWRQVLGGSFMRPLTIFLCSVLVWGFVFAVSYEGFRFLQLQQFDLSGGAVSMLFDNLFFSLAILPVFSPRFVPFSPPFSPPRPPLLLSLPPPHAHIFPS